MSDGSEPMLTVRPTPTAWIQVVSRERDPDVGDAGHVAVDRGEHEVAGLDRAVSQSTGGAFGRQRLALVRER